ncbi:PIG-L deacetylase family protein [Bordetella genomosp. 11]|uniref:PIG-L deacetylase family protein n=1 Tax=Bordetella genomosp. 11 TaxID=1416808 RepID=UPI0015951DCC|nr:PIG-L family deacetylase [Bordetella genomosp. 11]
MQSIDEPGTIVAISPHLDDAVAGCGALLAGAPGSTVITVFAGVPEAAVPVTEWDRRCGFGDGQAAMTWRLGEDDKALHLLKAQPARLPFLDDQYVRAMGRTPPKVDKIAHAVQGILEKAGARTVLFPLGLFHRDHILASDAALALFAGRQDRRWVAYEDALYRNKPGLLQGRLVQFYTRGVCLTPVAFRNTNTHRKATAMAAYASQMAELGITRNEGDTTAPERYWLLSESVKQAPESGVSPS